MARGVSPAGAQRICPRPAGEALGGSATIIARAAGGKAGAESDQSKEAAGNHACSDRPGEGPLQPRLELEDAFAFGTENLFHLPNQIRI